MPGPVRKPKSAPAPEKPGRARRVRPEKDVGTTSNGRRRRTAKLPLLPIRDQVYFPHMIFPLLVGREKSVRALEEAAARERHILIVTQRNLQAEDPAPEDIYEIGIVAEIMQVLRVPDGTVRVMLEGIERC